MAVTYINRSQVGYRRDLPQLGRFVDPSRRTEVIHHHTVTIDHDATPNTWETRNEVLAKARQMQTIRPDLGLDVPYNALVFCTTGGGVTLVEGRGWARSGAHTAGHNISGFGFGWVGDFRRNLPAGFPSQVEQLAGWVRDNLRPAWANIAEVKGHKDFKNTNCPGQVYTYLDLFRTTLFQLPQPQEDDMAALQVIELQKALNLAGAQPALAEDDAYGPKTKAAFVAALKTGSVDLSDFVFKTTYQAHKHSEGITGTPV